MVQVLEKTDIGKIKIVDSEDIGDIRSALDSILYVPNIQIRQRIIEELCRYLQLKLNDKEYKIKVFIGYTDSEVCSFVTCQIDPYYSSYTDPNSQIIDYLTSLGYNKESEYTCVYVAQKSVK